MIKAVQLFVDCGLALYYWGVLGWLLVVVIFAPTWVGSLVICSVCCMLYCMVCFKTSNGEFHKLSDVPHRMMPGVVPLLRLASIIDGTIWSGVAHTPSLPVPGPKNQYALKCIIMSWILKLLARACPGLL